MLEQLTTGNIIILLIVLMVVAIWDLVWKGIALYLSTQRKQKVWFVFLLVVNSLGILPIIYLILNKGKKKRSQ